MILDKIENIELYRNLGVGFQKAIEFIQKNEIMNLSDGRYDLGEGLYFMKQHYTTCPPKKGKWEVHRKYIDLQLILEGKEQMGYAPVSQMIPGEPYDAERDLQFFQGDGNLFAISKGFFCIFFPSDAHMPGVCENDSKVWKLVIKIPV